jgi:SPOR domain/PilZ domain
MLRPSRIVWVAASARQKSDKTMPDTLQAVEDLRTPERRSHRRQNVLFSCIQLGDGNGGTVLNVNERGLALQAIRSLNDKRLRRMRFQLSRSQTWLEAQGRIAWINTSKNTAGVEFVNLPDEARNRIKQWMSLVIDSKESLERTGQVDKRKDFVEKPSQDSTILKPSFLTQPADSNIDHPPQPLKEAELRARPSVILAPQILESDRETIFPRAVTDHPNRFLPIIAFVVLVAVLAVGLFGLTRYRRSARPGVKKAQNTATAAPPTVPDVKPTSAPNSAPVQVPPSPPAALESVTGFVLQAGAMTHRDNAVALANSLQQKHFPTFVYKGNSSPFYLVMIGPYPNKEASAKVRRELRTQGIDTFIRQWPSQ